MRGLTKVSEASVTEQVLTMLPVFWGICGWKRMIFIVIELQGSVCAANATFLARALRSTSRTGEGGDKPESPHSKFLLIKNYMIYIY